MMLLKTNNLKFTINIIILLLAVQLSFAQETAVTTDSIATVETEITVPKDTVKTPFTKFKVDGVAGVVGDYLILESDIDKLLIEIKSQTQSTSEITPCQVLGNLLESKLLAHQAVQDSLIVPDSRVNSEVDQIIERFAGQLGSEQKVVEYYKKDNISDLRAEFLTLEKIFYSLKI